MEREGSGVAGHQADEPDEEDHVSGGRLAADGEVEDEADPGRHAEGRQQAFERGRAGGPPLALVPFAHYGLPGFVVTTGEFGGGAEDPQFLAGLGEGRDLEQVAALALGCARGLHDLDFDVVGALGDDHGRQREQGEQEQQQVDLGEQDTADRDRHERPQPLDERVHAAAEQPAVLADALHLVEVVGALVVVEPGRVPHERHDLPVGGAVGVVEDEEDEPDVPEDARPDHRDAEPEPGGREVRGLGLSVLDGVDDDLGQVHQQRDHDAFEHAEGELGDDGPGVGPVPDGQALAQAPPPGLERCGHEYS